MPHRVADDGCECWNTYGGSFCMYDGMVICGQRMCGFAAGTRGDALLESLRGNSLLGGRDCQWEVDSVRHPYSQRKPLAVCILVRGRVTVCSRRDSATLT